MDRSFHPAMRAAGANRPGLAAFAQAAAKWVRGRMLAPLNALVARRRRLHLSLHEALDRSKLAEQRLRLASQIAGVGYWRRDLAAASTEWSDETFLIHGMTPLGPGRGDEGASALYPEAELARLRDTIAQMAANSEPAEVKARMRRQSDGAERIIHYKGEVERDAVGAVVAVFGVVRDITESETFLQRLEESEGRYRLLADSATDVVMRSGATNRLEYVSPSARRYGFEPKDLIGVPIVEMIHPDDLVRVREQVAQLFATGEAAPLEEATIRLRVGDGGWAWFEGNPTLVRGADGQVEGMISTLRDVSERVAAEGRLKESESRYRLLTENATDMISCFDPEGRFCFVSPASKDVLGFTAAELVGRPATDFIHPEDLGRIVADLEAYVAAGPRAPPPRYEFRGLRKDGGHVWLESHPRSVFDAETGELLEIQDLCRDISARKAMEAELTAVRDEAQAAVAVKSEFMANISHEIRTPLTAILGFTSLLSVRTGMDEEARYQVSRIAGAGQALLAIVNDILDFSKLEAGKMPIEPKPVSPFEILSDALALFEAQISAKGLDAELACAESLPSHLRLDPDRLRQILLNLIGNAVKFTEAGKVTVSARYDAKAERLIVSVADTGAGMEPEHQSKLFQRFSQVDASASRRHEGTGLGLAICSGLVQAMSGMIGVASAPGQGSVFTVEIPAPTCAAPRRAELGWTPVDLSNVRILVVDDNPVNRELARHVLEPLGAEVFEAEDGLSAVQRAAAEPYDLILMDIRMPGMDGPDATLRIRNQPGPNRDTAILAFSADYDVARFGEQGARGFDGFVRKPLDLRDLMAAISAALAAQEAA